MPELNVFYDLIAKLLPFESMQMRFMQQALAGLLLLAPMVAMMGVQVASFRMAFFADAISHSAFTGVALGLILVGQSALGHACILGLLVGLAIVASQRRSSLSTDTVVGVFFSGVVAFGLAVVSRNKNVARDIQRFLYGDILTIGDSGYLGDGRTARGPDLFSRCMVTTKCSICQPQSRLLPKCMVWGSRPTSTSMQGFYRLWSFFRFWAVGVLLVTAMLIVPAAAARNFARTAGGMVWWALLVSTTSAVIGLLISAQDWARTATGATVILVAFVWFLVSSGVYFIRGEGRVR